MIAQILISALALLAVGLLAGRTEIWRDDQRASLAWTAAIIALGLAAMFVGNRMVGDGTAFQVFLIGGFMVVAGAFSIAIIGVVAAVRRKGRTSGDTGHMPSKEY